MHRHLFRLIPSTSRQGVRVKCARCDEIRMYKRSKIRRMFLKGIPYSKNYRTS